MYWYGMALRDNDIEHLKNRVCLINRYPLMDVSLTCINTGTALCKEEHFLRDYLPPAAFLPEGLQVHARLLSPS